MDDEYAREFRRWFPGRTPAPMTTPTAPLTALWERLAQDIHASGYSVRDAIAANRDDIEAAVRAEAFDGLSLDQMEVYNWYRVAEERRAEADVLRARIAELEAALGDLSPYWFDRESNPARVRCRGCDVWCPRGTHPSAFQHDPAGCPVQRAHALAPGTGEAG